MNIHDTLLLFGASGDLSRRYLFPALGKAPVQNLRAQPNCSRSRWTCR